MHVLWMLMSYAASAKHWMQCKHSVSNKCTRYTSHFGDQPQPTTPTCDAMYDVAQMHIIAIQMLDQHSSI